MDQTRSDQKHIRPLQKMIDATKVCPSCGSSPWDFRDLGEHERTIPQPEFCQDCGDKLVLRSELPRDIWKDPAVKEALKSGRFASDIAVLECPECNNWGYYNEGSTFSCRFCDLTFYVMSENDDQREGIRTVSADEVISLADTVTVTTDGYDNQTL